MLASSGDGQHGRCSPSLCRARADIRADPSDVNQSWLTRTAASLNYAEPRRSSSSSSRPVDFKKRAPGLAKLKARWTGQQADGGQSSGGTPGDADAINDFGGLLVTRSWRRLCPCSRNSWSRRIRGVQCGNDALGATPRCVAQRRYVVSVVDGIAPGSVAMSGFISPLQAAVPHHVPWPGASSVERH